MLLLPIVCSLSYHSTDLMVIPTESLLLYLPPYSPDLNPIEESFSTREYSSTLYCKILIKFNQLRHICAVTMPRCLPPLTLSLRFLRHVDVSLLRWRGTGFCMRDTIDSSLIYNDGSLQMHVYQQQKECGKRID
jgi:hypothetical protein